MGTDTITKISPAGSTEGHDWGVYWQKNKGAIKEATAAMIGLVTLIAAPYDAVISGAISLAAWRGSKVAFDYLDYKYSTTTYLAPAEPAESEPVAPIDPTVIP